MATAVGSYATLTNVKTRLSQAGQTFGTGDDAILQTLCNQVNAWIEAKTGRIFTPYTLINTTLSATANAGDTSVTLTSATGVVAGDAILFGPVSGTHEHGIVTSVSGSVASLQWALVNGFASGTAVTRVQLFDGYDALEMGRMLPVSNGIVYATSVEVAFYTGGTYNLIPGTDWFLRPTPLEREPGWPATEIWMTDIPSSNNACPTFTRGMANIRVACQPGWPATPDEIVALAEKMVVGAYRARGSGGGSAVTIGSDGSRVIEQALTSQDWALVRRYSAQEAVIL